MQLAKQPNPIDWQALDVWRDRFLACVPEEPCALESLRNLVSEGCAAHVLMGLLYFCCQRDSPEVVAERERRKRVLQLKSELLEAFETTRAKLTELGEMAEELQGAGFPGCIEEYSKAIFMIKQCLTFGLPDPPSGPVKKELSRTVRSDARKPDPTDAECLKRPDPADVDVSTLLDLPIDDAFRLMGVPIRDEALMMEQLMLDGRESIPLDPSRRGDLRAALQSVPLFEYVRKVTGGPCLLQIGPLLKCAQKAAGGGIDDIEAIYKRYQRYVQQFPSRAETMRAFAEAFAMAK